MLEGRAQACTMQPCNHDADQDPSQRLFTVTAFMAALKSAAGLRAEAQLMTVPTALRPAPFRPAHAASVGSTSGRSLWWVQRLPAHRLAQAVIEAHSPVQGNQTVSNSIGCQE